jgi:hypothetical protein
MFDFRTTKEFDREKDEKTKENCTSQYYVASNIVSSNKSLNVNFLLIMPILYFYNSSIQILLIQSLHPISESEMQRVNMKTYISLKRVEMQSNKNCQESN